MPHLRFSRTARTSLALLCSLGLTCALLSPTATPAAAQIVKVPVAFGYGGAVSTVDADATDAGLAVLRRGGNAVDAAVAAAAVLGVTEPYSAGIGGGGYFVYYDAKSRRVHTLDGRETAPASLEPNSFLNYGMNELVTSGLSVGVPGTPATWQRALQRWGRKSLAENLQPAIRIAKRGFVVDATFQRQTQENAERFSNITSTSELFLPEGQAPEVGSVFRNPDLAETYRAIARYGVGVMYGGAIGREIVNTVQRPPTVNEPDLPVFPGELQRSDLLAYRVLDQRPTRVGYRGLDVYGMAPSSSGGTTVGEALNILERFNLRTASRIDALHYYLDASALAFADRNAYVGDPAYGPVPTQTLLSQRFANSRACLIPEDNALPTPTPAGDLSASGCRATATPQPVQAGQSTTHLTTSDRWGNVVSYTLTIEATGGSGIVVPDRGFLLNNELTDFSYTSITGPNRIEGGKRPRSSMSPTIVLRDGQPVLALGSPGGATIITTVLQTLVNRLDFGLTLPQAVAAPRASHRNMGNQGVPTVPAEEAFIRLHGSELTDRGYTFTPAGQPGTSAAEIGAVAVLEFYRGGLVLAVAEPTRRGGGSAGVVTRLR
jgi:gamma-glutamyltranspeptidase / glutathione hydrolase